MKAIAPFLAAAVAALLHALPVSAQQGPITLCNADGQSNCLLQNRVCYRYEADEGKQECGYCILDYVEIDDECYAIEEIGTDGFLELANLLETYLPDYVDQDISTAVRALRLAAAAKIISSWNSQVPPPPFRLGLTNETFLTEEERSGRLGIASSITFEEDGARGQMERFESATSATAGFFDEEDDEDGDVLVEDDENGRRKKRRLSGNERKLEDLPPPPPMADWHADGYTTGVKQQALCGCCWAVSVAAAVESALMITNQTNRFDSDERNDLSFQQMISCDEKELGCGGGNILQATRYVWEHDDFENGNFGGLVSAADWPYTDYLGQTTTTCESDGKVPRDFTPAAYLNYPKIVNSVNDRSSFEERRDRMIQAVSLQPAITVMRSGCDLFMNYIGGILTHDSGCECGSTSCIDHAVVVVGYDTQANPPYWKVRNSWGPGWGELGHFRVAMNDRGDGEWGLFGIIAENAVPSQAYKNLQDLPERPGWWETSATWEKVLVILFSILGFCCLCGCLAALFRKRRN